MNNEVTMNKLVCPKQHNVTAHPSGGYYCKTCAKVYGVDELKSIPLDKTGTKPDPYYKPTVYGRMN